MKKFLILLLLFFPLTTKAFETSAKAGILMDMDSHRILYSKNIHYTQSVASISKIMTGILAVESGKMDEIVTIGEEIYQAHGSGIYIKEGEKLTLRDLVYGLMLRSGNDAALAIATFVSGSKEKFVQLMNEKAKEIGMLETTFHNPHGLDDEEEGNISSAYDMAILTSYASQNKEYLKIVGTKKYTLKTNKNTYVWHNKNKLLTMYPYATGGKTGYTKKAKRTLVTTASYKNLNLVAVTINDGNDFNDHKQLFEEAYENYQSYSILEKGNFPVYSDTYYTDYRFKIKNKFSAAFTKEERKNLYLKIDLLKKRKIKEGEKIGTVSVMLDDKIFHKENIYIYEKEKEKKSFFSKIKDFFYD